MGNAQSSPFWQDSGQVVTFAPWIQLPASPTPLTMTTESSFDVSLRVFEDAAEIFALLSTPCRLRIVDALCAGEKNVGELLRFIPVTQSNMSQHLTVLYRAGLVTRRRSGAQVFYRIGGHLAGLVCQVVQSQLAADTQRARPCMDV